MGHRKYTHKRVCHEPHGKYDLKFWQKKSCTCSHIDTVWQNHVVYFTATSSQPATDSNNANNVNEPVLEKKLNE